MIRPPPYARSVIAFPQDAPQPHPHLPIQTRKRRRMAVPEVREPSPQGRIQLGEDHLQMEL